MDTHTLKLNVTDQNMKQLIGNGAPHHVGHIVLCVQNTKSFMYNILFSKAECTYQNALA